MNLLSHRIKLRLRLSKREDGLRRRLDLKCFTQCDFEMLHMNFHDLVPNETEDYWENQIDLRRFAKTELSRELTCLKSYDSPAFPIPIKRRLSSGESSFSSVSDYQSTVLTSFSTDFERSISREVHFSFLSVYLHRVVVVPLTNARDGRERLLTSANNNLWKCK